MGGGPRVGANGNKQAYWQVLHVTGRVLRTTIDSRLLVVPLSSALLLLLPKVIGKRRGALAQLEQECNVSVTEEFARQAKSLPPAGPRRNISRRARFFQPGACSIVHSWHTRVL